MHSNAEKRKPKNKLKLPYPLTDKHKQTECPERIAIHHKDRQALILKVAYVVKFLPRFIMVQRPKLPQEMR